MSTPPIIDRDRPARTETALFALGCFWSPDARFGALPGVVRTSSGYAGGSTVDPTYHTLGDHTETVEVEFDPDAVTYEELLDLFWQSHDATRKPWKRQYRSALFVLDDEQEAAARASKAQADAQIDSQIRTAIERVDRFYLAEDYHQNHRLRQHAAFERVYETLYPEPEAFAHSAAASRANGYLAGHGSAEHLARDLGRLGLDEERQTELRQQHERSRNKRTGRRSLFGV